MIAQPNPEEGIYLEDLYDPRRRISCAFFPVFALLVAVMPVMIFFGVPTLLNLAASGRRSNGLLFGQPPLFFAPYLYAILIPVYLYVVLTVCINRMRASGRPFWQFFVPGYNLYILFMVPDRARDDPGSPGY